jgi:hypothetical protein
MMALLDSWALAGQMQAFLAAGSAGAALLGPENCAPGVASQLNSEAEELAARLIPAGEREPYRAFVAGYIREHPFASFDFVRPSVVELWSRAAGADQRLVDSLGTIPEAMTDFSDRLKISSSELTQQTMWRTQLALRTSGYGGADLRTALRQLDERLKRLSVAAEDAPHLLRDAIGDVRRSLIDVLAKVDASSNALMVTLHTEREALAADVGRERAAIVSAADAQRQALTADAARLAEQVVRSAGEEARRLAREVLVLLCVLAAVVLGLPFAAGYLAGRAHARTRAP